MGRCFFWQKGYKINSGVQQKVRKRKVLAKINKFSFMRKLTKNQGVRCDLFSVTIKT